MDSSLQNPYAMLAMLGVGVTVVLLVLWTARSLEKPARRQSFDDAIKLQQFGSELDIDTALNRSELPKLSMFSDWGAYWERAFVLAGHRPKDPKSPGRVAIGAAACAGGLGWALLGQVPAIVIGALVGPFLVKVWTGGGAKKRAMTMEKQLPMLLAGLRANLQAGATAQQAIEQIAADMPSPLGDELVMVRQDLHVSTTLETALNRLAARVPSREMQFLVASIEIAVRSGADLDPQLATIEQIVAQRTRIRGKLRAAIAQVKPTKILAYGAPPVMFVLNGLRNAANRQYWFHGGMFMLVVAIVLYSVGVLVIRMMVKGVENA